MWRACLALLAVVAGCAAGEAGVHVEVVVDAAWDEGQPLDHVTVIARTADRTAAVCLFHDFTEVEVQLPDDAGVDPCGELPREWKLPEKADWVRPGKPRRVNLLLEAGTSVDLRAWGGLGGKVLTAVATAKASADVGFPTARLVLEKAGIPACNAHLNQDEETHGFALAYEGLELCNAPCFCAPPDTSCDPQDPARAEAIVSCARGAARIANRAAPGCELSINGAPAQEVAWHGPTIQLPAESYCSAHVRIRGNFARCAGGAEPTSDCQLSAACAPPRTEIGAVFDQLSRGNIDGEDISCLPPTVSPIVFSFDVSIDTGTSFNLAIPFITQVVGSDESCFFDLHEITILGDRCQAL